MQVQHFPRLWHFLHQFFGLDSLVTELIEKGGDTPRYIICQYVARRIGQYSSLTDNVRRVRQVSGLLSDGEQATRRA